MGSNNPGSHKGQCALMPETTISHLHTHGKNRYFHTHGAIGLGLIMFLEAKRACFRVNRVNLIISAVRGQ